MVRRMRLSHAPPAGWDARVSSPILSEGFAAAARGMGYAPYFLEDERDRALVLFRAVPLPLVRRWTLRAKVYVDRSI